MIMAMHIHQGDKLFENADKHSYTLAIAMYTFDKETTESRYENENGKANEQPNLAGKK